CHNYDLMNLRPGLRLVAANFARRQLLFVWQLKSKAKGTPFDVAISYDSHNKSDRNKEYESPDDYFKQFGVARYHIYPDSEQQPQHELRKVVYNVTLMEACKVAYNMYIDGNAEIPQSFWSLTAGMKVRGPYNVEGGGRKYLYDKRTPIMPNEGACGNYSFSINQEVSSSFNAMQSAFTNMQQEIRQFVDINTLYY